MYSPRGPRVSRRVLQLAAFMGGASVAAVTHAQDGAGDGAQAPLEEVFVLGRGETRQVQSINAQEIGQRPAGTSPLKAIENLPGVNFQSSDPYGAYEWSTRITVRGFNQNQLGFTLDGVPLGDMTYGNHNGLHISRAIPSELVDRVALSQGTGAIDTASASNLGGAIEFFSSDPRSEFGAQVEQTFGSDSAARTFLRLDSGVVGAGTRFYIAGVDSSTDKWKGAGEQKTRMYNLKLIQPVGDGTVTAYYDYSDRAENDYQDLSFDIVQRRGWDWDNWYPDYASAIAAAQACGTSGTCDDAYWNASGLRKDHLGYLALDMPFGESLRWKATGYTHRNDGQGLWGTPYVGTPGGAPLSVRTTEYDIDRYGVTTALSFTSGNHEIEGGVWYETNDFNQARRYYGEPSLAAPTRDFLEFQRGPFATDWEYDFETETTVLHVQDTWSITPDLRLNYGARSVRSKNTADTVVGAVKTGSIEAKKPFLPQVGLNWTLSDRVEAFGSAARNVRTFASSGSSGPFSTTAEGFAAIRDRLEPETSTNYEAGIRLSGATTQALLAVYHVDFKDRLLGIPQCVGIVSCFSAIANVGSVKTNGVEAALTWRPLTHFNWFTSVAWNSSEFDDNYTVPDGSGGVRVVQVKGKKVPDAPEIMLKSELSYDNGALFAHLDGNYTDERFYTYLNDGGVDAYTLFNVGMGYRFSDLGFVDELTLQADVTNLADKKYFGTIGTNGFTESDPNGLFQTLQRGAPRQFFFSAKARF